MAIITLVPSGTLIGARRLFSSSGFSLTVRSGRIFTKRPHIYIFCRLFARPRANT